MASHLRNGARFEIKLTQKSNDTVAYHCSIERADAPSVHFELTTPLETGEITLNRSEDTASEPIDDWIEDHLKTLSRQMVRTARKNGVWPRKVRRWHNAPKS